MDKPFNIYEVKEQVKELKRQGEISMRNHLGLKNHHKKHHKKHHKSDDNKTGLAEP